MKDTTQVQTDASLTPTVLANEWTEDLASRKGLNSVLMELDIPWTQGTAEFQPLPIFAGLFQAANTFTSKFSKKALAI